MDHCIISRRSLLTSSPRAFITLTSDKNVGLIDSSFHEDILRHGEDLSISKTCKDGVWFNSWHLKDLEKYEGHQENLADLFSSATDDPNCRIVNGKGFFIGRGRTEGWTIERERTESGKWLYVIWFERSISSTWTFGH